MSWSARSASFKVTPPLRWPSAPGPRLSTASVWMTRWRNKCQYYYEHHFVRAIAHTSNVYSLGKQFAARCRPFHGYLKLWEHQSVCAHELIVVCTCSVRTDFFVTSRILTDVTRSIPGNGGGGLAFPFDACQQIHFPCILPRSLSSR